MRFDVDPPLRHAVASKCVPPAFNGPRAMQVCHHVRQCARLLRSRFAYIRPPVRGNKLSLAFASSVQSLSIRAALLVALAGVAAAGVVAPAKADPPPVDPICNVFPHLERCIGSPQGLADSPSDAGCAFDPGDASCSASKLFGPSPGSIPALPGPSMPPPMGSDLPGSLNANGTPYGSAPMGIPGMPGSIP
jgi:hypothetical protein